MPKRVPLPDDCVNPFTVRSGYASGLSEKRMRGRDLTAPFSGVRAGPPRAETPFGAVVEACLAYSPLLLPHQFFSHTTAAMLWGCPLPTRFEPALPLHVTSIAPARAVERAGVVGHQVRPGGGGVARLANLPISDPMTTFLGLSTCLDLDDLVAVGDYLVFAPPRQERGRPLLSLSQLRSQVADFGGRGCRVARASAELVRQRTESRRETFLRLLLIRAGLPEPEVNPDLYSESGEWLGRADLVYRRWKVIVEYDGDQHRTDVRQYESDIERTERFIRAGWIVVKVRSSGLTYRAEHTIQRVTEALSSRGLAW